MIRSAFLLSVFLFFVGGCAPTPPNYSISSCSSDKNLSIVDAGSTSTGINAGAALGQHIRLTEDMLVKRVMLRMSSGGVTHIIISFFENFSSNDQVTFAGPIYNFTWIGNFSSGPEIDQWFTLPVPVLFKKEVDYMIGFAPNSNMGVKESADYPGGSVRGYYRPGTGPYNSWGNASQKAISIGLAGDADCL